MPKPSEQRQCERIKDGLRLPFSKQLAKRRDFRIIYPDGRSAPADAVTQPREMNFTPGRDTSIADYYADYDDVQLHALLANRGVSVPDSATREQMLASLAFFPLPEASGQPPVQANAPLAPENVPVDVLDALTKDQLVEKARVEYGYEMAPALTKAQMIETLQRIAPPK